MAAEGERGDRSLRCLADSRGSGVEKGSVLSDAQQKIDRVDAVGVVAPSGTLCLT